MSTATQSSAWATPYVSFYSTGGVAVLEFLQVQGNGKLSARHFMDVNAHKNELMDLASDAQRIVLGVDPGLVYEASYIVNNLVCAVMMAERHKVSLMPSSGNGITLYFYQDAAPVAKSTKKQTSHKHMPKRPHSHSSQPRIHIF